MKEIKCDIQGGRKVSEKWCDYAQYNEICEECNHNLGRDESKYQLEKKNERQRVPKA